MSSSIFRTVLDSLGRLPPSWFFLIIILSMRMWAYLLWSTTRSADWSDRAASDWTTQIFEDLCWNVICFRRVLLRWDSSTREIYITILTNRILNPVLFRFLKIREQYQGCRLPLVSLILSFTALRIAPKGILQFLC